MNRSIYIHTYDEIGQFRFRLGCVKNAGFKTVAISLLDNKTVFRKDFFDYIKSLKEELDRQEMICNDVHLPCYDILLPSGIVDEKMEDGLNDAVIAASIFGASWCVYHPRTAVDKGYDSKAAFEDNKKSLSRLLETAHKYNTGIAVENLAVFPDAPIHRLYTSDPDDICEIVDCFKSDKMAICWDTSHGNLMPFDQAKVIRQLGKRIKALHLGNNFKTRDDHALMPLGNVDWEKVIGALKEIGYDGVLTLEANLVPDRFIPNFMNLAFDSATYLKELFEK